MNTSRSGLRSVFSVAVIVCALVAGCGPAVPPADQVYTVRGVIKQLPEEGKPANSLMIMHEPIENFVRSDGKLGMNTMTMPFPPAKGLSLEGLAIGDIVEVVWEVRKSAEPRSQVTSIKKLAPDTELHFGKVGG